jgi:hypothetical protein
MTTTSSSISRAGSAGTREKFDREKFFPSGWQLGTPEFLSLFHRYGYICKPINGGSWFSPDEKWQLTDTEILKAIACAHPRFFIGTRSGRATRFAVIDIDAGSKYHDIKQVHKIQAALKDAGIAKSILYRSSMSGGWHLYIFFSELISSKDLHNQLVSLLVLHSFRIAKGTLEVFPSPGDGSLGYGLRLPLQPGWAWLNQETGEVSDYREDMHSMEALGMFMADLAEGSNSRHDFHQLKRHFEELQSKKEKLQRRQADPPVEKMAAQVIPIRRTEASRADPEAEALVISIFKHLPPNINPADWLRGRQYYMQGLTGPSQRADAIFSLGHYFFYGDPETDLRAMGYGYESQRQWLIEEILRTKHNNCSDDISAGRADALAQVERAAHWRPAPRREKAERQYKPEVPLQWVRANAKRKSDARKRIVQAVNELSADNKSFSLRQLRQAAKCSMDTIYKHKDLWQADYEDVASDFFAGDPGEYNAVEEAACPKLQPPSTTESKATPPGLLAARRIAYEIGMRSNWRKKKSGKQTREQRQSNDEGWRARTDVAVLEAAEPDTPLEKLVAIANALTFYLLTAPSEEDANALHAQIGVLKRQIRRRQVAAGLKVVSANRTKPAKDSDPPDDS